VINRPDLPHPQDPQPSGRNGKSRKTPPRFSGDTRDSGTQYGAPAARTPSRPDPYADPYARDPYGNSPYGNSPYGTDPGPAEPPHTPRKSVRRRARNAFRWISVAVIATLLVTGGYAVYNYQRFVSNLTRVDAIVPGATDIDGEAQNILLVGDDHRPADATAEDLARLGTEADGGGTSTDTMMVLHLPADGGQATLISFPRDSWVEIPGFGKGKLNSAFANGSAEGGDAAGAQLLIQVIQNLTGLSIDHYVRVSMLGFYNVIEALGPVDVCLNNAVDDPYSTLNLPAGVSTLNAQQALSFVRQRHGLPNGDLDRQVRQQYFLSVEARAVLSPSTLLNPGRLQAVLDAVSGATETDPDLNFLSLGTSLARLGADNINSATVPVAGTPTVWSGGAAVSIVELDMAAMPTFISGIVGMPTAYESATAAAPGDVTVTVLNGSGVGGAAASGTQTLAGLGFMTGTPGNADLRTTTTIEYPPGQEREAKALAAALPGADVLASASVDGVTLVLGANGIDGAMVAPVAPVAPVDGGTDAAPAAPVDTPTGFASTGTEHSYAAGTCIN
jgi:LCP family protein required for cell wall assembly